MSFSRPFCIALAVLLLACSSTRNGRDLRVGDDGSQQDGGSAGSGGPVAPEDAGTGDGLGPLGVQVADIAGTPLAELAVQCTGDCIQVLAVATGGNPPYAFEWEDGSVDPRREVCPDGDETLEVTVTDTAIMDSEFQYTAQTASTDIGTQVLACEDGGTADLCTGVEVEGPPPGHYVGTLDCPAATSSGGASGQMGQITFDFSAGGSGTLFFQWSLVVIGAQATVGTPECLDGDFHALYAGQWGVPGAADPNMPKAPPPLLPTGPIDGDFTVEAGAAPGTISGSFSWYAPPVAGADASICHGTYTAMLVP